MKKNIHLNNRGFSLVEIIVSIAVLAIVITPLMNSFITAARVNKDARKVTCAADCAQSIMEGFADKTGTEIWSICSKGGNLTGSKMITTMNSTYDNVTGKFDFGPYNLSANSYWFNGCPLSHLTQTEFSGTGWSGDTAALAGHMGEYIGFQMAKQFGRNMQAQFDSGTIPEGTKALFRGGMQCQLDSGSTLKTNELGAAAFFGFSNIEWENYTFDAVVIFIPAAIDINDKYYTYTERIYVFDHEDFADIVNGTVTGTYLSTMDSGIRNK